MKTILHIAILFCCVTTFGQRLVLPGEDKLSPQLNDPSFVGENGRVQATGLLQLSDSDIRQTTQYLNAQVPIYDNVMFGADFFKDYFDYFSYTSAMATTAVKFGFGDARHFLKIGVSGGVDSRKQDRIPLDQLPDNPEFIPNINDTNTDFTYRAGLHYTMQNLTLGGFYNRIPVQNILTLNDAGDQLSYSIENGYTAYLDYNIRLSDKLRVVPIVRYLSYADDALYEGALRFDVKDRLSASVSYKNDYSINPAVRFQFFKVLQVGYFYEKALGSRDFSDIHGVSASIKFNKGTGEEEPEWMETAKESIEKREANKQKKTKKKSEAKTQKAKKKEAAKAERNSIPDEAKSQETANTSNDAANTDSPKKTEERLQTEPAKAEDNPNESPKRKPVVIVLAPRYYIVAGSFDTVQEALALKERIVATGKNAIVGTTEADNKYHVSMGSDFDKTAATERMAALKASSGFKNLQLLKVE